MSKEHYEKYETLAQKIGIEKLKELVPMSVNEINTALSENDNYFNNSTSLKAWDLQHGMVRFYAYNAGINSWALAQTVSVLKHVARYHMGNGKPPTE